jgi:hypothetical protein
VQRLARRNLERELVITDADPVAVGQCRGAANAFATHVDSVGRAQIGDHETGAGVDDDGVVAADVGVVEHDAVVGESPDPGGGGQQWIDQSRRRAQTRQRRRRIDCGAQVDVDRGVHRGGPGGSLHVEGFLAKDPLV